MTATRDVYAGRPPLPVIDVSASYIDGRLGTTLGTDAIVAKLTGLEFGVERLDDDRLRVSVPPWRATKDISIADDLVEEVGRLHGYDNIAPASPVAPLPKPYRHPGRTFRRRVRTALSFGATLLGALARNRTQVDAARLYELGRVFQRVSGDVPAQPYRLGLVMWEKRSGDWTTDQREALARLKDTLAVLGSRLGVNLSYARLDSPLPWLHPARSAAITLADGTVVGQVGAVHPAACEALELGGFAAAAEIELDLLQGAARDAYGYEPVPKFPASPVDLSVIVAVGVLHADVATTLRASAPEHVRSIEFVADFRGAPIPDGQKSLTYRLLFQSPERTMAMTEVQAEVNACVEVLAARFGAWVRA